VRERALRRIRSRKRGRPRKHQTPLRKLTAPLRALPDFLIVGAMKSGSSSLYSWMAAHPLIERSLIKEPNYFAARDRRSLIFYRRFFPLALPLRLRGALTMEASPGYLYHPAVPRRIREQLGNRRIIAILREPVARSVSHYKHLLTHAGETRSLEKMLAEVPPRDEGYVYTREDPCGWSLRPHNRDVVARSIYDVQLRRYIETFGRQNLHVIFLEELAEEPQRVLDEAFRFVGLEPAPIDTGRVWNRGYELEIAPETIAHLQRRFAEPNARLGELLGRRLPW
jgi:hypothetical protein